MIQKYDSTAVNEMLSTHDKIRKLQREAALIQWPTVYLEIVSLRKYVAVSRFKDATIIP